jgi:hypothetical protein
MHLSEISREPYTESELQASSEKKIKKIALINILYNIVKIRKF